MVKYLMIMIFCHIIADFNLQGILADMKQQNWWLGKSWDWDKYKHDYICALLVHSFEWTFCIMLIWLIKFNVGWQFYWMFIINVVVHMVVDNSKANKRSINLCQDQAFHIVMIIATWCWMIVL